MVESLKLLKQILTKESVDYTDEDLLVVIDKHYPDIRSMVNALQYGSRNGILVLSQLSDFRSLHSVLELIYSGNLTAIRKLALEYTEVYKYLFNKVDELTDDYEKRVKLSLTIADFMHKDVFSPDKEINFAACCITLIEQLGVKVK